MKLNFTIYFKLAFLTQKNHFLSIYFCIRASFIWQKLFHIEESDIYNQYKTQTCYEFSLLWIFCGFLTRFLTLTNTNYFFIDLSLESVFNTLHDFNETLESFKLT